MSMNTPAGQIKYLTKHIKDFEDIEEMDGEQYLLGIQEIQRGVGGKVKLKDVITSTMSNDENNLLKKGTDDKLFVQDKAGDLEDLVTTNKYNLVSAINEVSQKIVETGALSDIVSTYSDLMFYDTSRLNDGNIIQVLNDETHKGKTTYYKWVEETSSFEFLGESGISEASLNTKFAINKGNSNLLNAPGSGTIEQQGTVEGWSWMYPNFEQTIYRTFETPKLLKGTFSVGTRLFPNHSSAVQVAISIVLNDDTEIEIANHTIPGYQDVWYTDTYTFTEPTVVKSVKMYGHIAGSGSFSVHEVSFTEIVSVSTADTLFFNVSEDDKLTYTNAVSNSRTVDFLNPINVESLQNGNYKVILPDSGESPYLFNGRIFKQETEPSQPNANDIWLNPQEPYEAKQFKDGTWQEFNEVVLQDSNVKIASGVITEIKQPTYNYNGIELNQSSKTNVEYMTRLGIPNYKDRRQGVTGFNIWKTVQYDCWVSGCALTANVNRTLFLELKDENGNIIQGATDSNGIMRAQQGSSNCMNQVFAYIPKGYSYQLKIDSHQTFSQCWEFPLKGAY